MGKSNNNKEDDKSIKLSIVDKFTLTIRSALQIFPFGIGSAVDVGVFGYMGERRLKHIEAFLSALKNDLDALTASQIEKIDLSYFDSDDFGHLFMRVLQSAASEVNRRKLAALRGALFNIMVNQPREPFDKESSFLRTLEVMEEMHVRVLQMLVNQNSQGPVSMTVSEICRGMNAIVEADRNFIYSVLDTLANREFIISGPIPFTADGRIAKPRQEFSSTALGRDFLRFVRQDSTAKDGQHVTL
jgi:hypothetical protein